MHAERQWHALPFCQAFCRVSRVPFMFQPTIFMIVTLIAIRYPRCLMVLRLPCLPANRSFVSPVRWLSIHEDVCLSAWDRNSRKPTPETPGDSVVILSDTTGDGRADTKKVFATGFNAVQALAWHGNDLWIANAPDLTVVRDLDGDDEADQYIRLYTDLGNLEHGLHGLNWAPDGKLYMSKGNSKGLTLPDRLAPKPFRELWGVESPAHAPDMPEPKVFSKENYQRSFHDPNDDWGLDGGVLRCNEDGTNLEIVARGFRNPWDITMDSQFNWLGTDNDQTGGDRIIMPFYGAHFGWNHPWSAHWTPDPHPPSAPVSGPLFEGSGTGIVFGDGLKFPLQYRDAFFINDWLNKTTYVWRPEWDGALMRPASGDWEPFIVGGDSLFRPTDMEVGPDGALWILGWSRGYGAEWKDGKLVNEGRVYRVAMEKAAGDREVDQSVPLREKIGQGTRHAIRISVAGASD